MAQETLRLDIVANNKDAVAALKQTDAELKKVASSALQTGQNVARGSNQAANALTNLGRVAQDAPFGFIGIQNNLNPLLESFQRLKAETGSTGGALKALAGSLVGPAGLGLALSVGGALLVAFGDKLTSASAATKALDAQQKTLTDTLSKNLGQAKAEVTTMQVLSGIVNDVSKSTTERARALKQLKDEYPGYEALQKVDINDTAKLAEVTNTLSAAILRKARVEAYSALIAAEEAKQVKIALENDKQRADRLGVISKAIKDYALPLLKLTNSVAANATATGLQIDALKAAGEEYDSNKKFIESLKQSLTAVTGEQIKNNDATILGNSAKKESKRVIKENTDALAEYIKQEQYLRTVQQQGMRNVTPRTVLAGDYSQPSVQPTDAMVQRTQATMAATKAQLEYANSVRLTTMNEEAAAAMTNVAVSAFTSLGNAMLMGQDMGEALGNVFKKLIIDLTQMVVKALVFKAIMASLTGGTSAVAGAAAGGGGFLNIFKGLMGFSDGGIATGPKSGYPVMLHGTEAVLNPRQFQNLTSNMMNLGAARGGGMMNVQVEGVLRGQDILLQRTRAERALGLRR
jgi:hypothetical protein